MISLDVGVTKDGWVADAAITVPVGSIDPRLGASSTQPEALVAGAREVRPGNHLGDVSAAIQRQVESRGFSIIRSLVGHGIGRDMHEDPQIPNYGEPGRGPELEPGMVLAIEPMVTAGGPDVRVGEDNWAVYSADGSLTAHFEYTVAVTEDGPRVLTPWHQGDLRREVLAEHQAAVRDRRLTGGVRDAAAFSVRGQRRRRTRAAGRPRRMSVAGKRWAPTPRRRAGDGTAREGRAQQGDVRRRGQEEDRLWDSPTSRRTLPPPS